MEAIQRDYAPQGVKFYYVYKSLAHPETNGYVKPFNLQERLLHVKEAQRRLETGFQWICDSMENEVKHALGDAPNSEFVIDPDGIIVRRRAWSDPKELRRDLEELIGPVAEPTSDVVVEFKPPSSDEGRSKSGVVERLKTGKEFEALKIEPSVSGDEIPFYAKLRAEATDQLLQTGNGKMYLGFHLDPIYRVHWNNLAQPLEFQLAMPDGLEAEPREGRGPKLDEAADVDPREFLIDVQGDLSDQPIELTVQYVACDDAESFCVPVTQRYKIFLQRDSEGGWVFARGRRPDAERLVALHAVGPIGSLRPVEDSEVAKTLQTTGETASGDQRPRKPLIMELRIDGQLEGQIRGEVDGRLDGSFRGRLVGTLGDSLATTLRGRFDGQLSGRFQGKLDGHFSGHVNGKLRAASTSAP